MAENEDKSRNLKLLAVSLVFSIVVIGLVLYFTVDQTTIDYLRAVKAEFFGLAIVLQLVVWTLWGLRIHLLTRMVDRTVDVGIKESISIVLSNLFLAAVTPSMAGGEPVRIHLLSKRGLGAGSSTAIVFGERIFDAIFVLTAMPFALFVFQHVIATEIIRIGITIGIILFILGIALFFYAAAKPRKVKRFLKWLSKKVRWKKSVTFLQKIDNLVDDFHKGSMLIFHRGNIVFISIIFCVTASSWLAGFLIPSSILLSLEQDPIVMQSIAAQVILLVIILIPTTPGSSGVAEGAASLLYGGLVNKSILGVLIVLWRFITFHVNIIVGGGFQYKLFKTLKPKKTRKR